MEISDIKQRLKIETVLKYYGLQANRNHMLKCPFHEEKEPSLKIYPNTNTFNCFGCKANGDTIEFIQLKEKCSKHAAILKAKEILAVPTDSVGEALKKATELINPVESKELFHRGNPIETAGQQVQAPPACLPKQSEGMEPPNRNGSPSLKASANTEKIELLTKLFGYFRKAINNSKPSRNYITGTRRLDLFLEIGYNSAQFHHGHKRDEQLINECVKYGMLSPTLLYNHQQTLKIIIGIPMP